MAGRRKGSAGAAPVKGDWSHRYGQRHRLVRVDLPDGVHAPDRVRIYRRSGHFVLQWWDPKARKNLCDRVDGDLIAAIARAREIDERIRNYKGSGQVSRRVRHADLADAFLENLERRADAGEIAVSTVERHRTALAHYRAFVEQPRVSSRPAYATGIDRDFALEFAVFLNGRRITPNGRPGATTHLMKGQDAVVGAVRAMLQWAADPEQGRLLPAGFRNPFLGASRTGAMSIGDREEELDITTGMAVEFLGSCDEYQLPLFGVILFAGLRASEAAFIFREHVDDEYVRVQCIPELFYTTKGRRDKKVPLLGELRSLVPPGAEDRREGLLFVRRRVVAGGENVPLASASLEELAAELERRCADESDINAVRRLRIRDAVLRDAGAITYRTIEREFHRVAGKLGWPRRATVKDFRHLFATSMANGGVPEHHLKYLMAHSRGKAALVRYTRIQIEKVRVRYEAAVEREWPELVEALGRRARELGLATGAAKPGTSS